MKINKFIAMLCAGLTMWSCGNKEAEPQIFIGKQTVELQNDLMTPEALWAMGRIGGVSISPDNKEIVYNVSYYSVKENKSHTVIYKMKSDGSDNQMLTKSNSSQNGPVFIAGGKKIAFLSSEDGQSCLYTMNSDGTGVQKITGFDMDVEDFKFSLDEGKVILIAQIPYNHNVEKGSEKYEDLPQTTGLIVKDALHKHWDEWVHTIPHPFIADFDGKEFSNVKDILEGEPFECPGKPFGGVEQLSWSPDGKFIAYSCKKMEGVDYAVSTDSDIYEYNIETGEVKNLCKPEGYTRPHCENDLSFKDQNVNKKGDADLNMGYDTNPCYSPDGKKISWLSMERDGYESDRNRLCIYDRENGVKSYITESFESGVDDYVWKNNDELYFLGVWHATEQIYSTNLYGEVKQITEGVHDFGSLALCGNNIIAKRHSMQVPDDIYNVDPQSGAATQITFENKDILDKLALGNVEERWTKTTDGKQMLSWVVYPPHFDKSKKYPTLLFCEGGPQSPVSQFWSYRWNFQIMAANGYIIIAPNRRGLPGFGMEWLEEISGDYGGQCMKDYLSAIDDIAKEEYVDAEHLGCVGASFGGFSVYYLAGNHNKRFKAFIAHDGMFNFNQQYLETEEAWFTNWDLGGAYWKSTKDTKNNYAASPHLFADKWDTPILCIHGEKDYRILASQGESAFNAAILRGVPAELLLYPNENHWVLKPQNGILWQRTFFEWLDKWLKDDTKQ